MQDMKRKCVNREIMNKPEEKNDYWYPLRITGGECLEFKSLLDESGIVSYFDPKAFRNVIFVKASMDVIEEIKQGHKDSFSVHYLWDGVTFRPARIAEKTMSDFLKVAGQQEGSPLYLETVSSLLKDCQSVRVTSGVYSGIEGKLVRIKKSKRVMIALPGDIAVATEYIRPDCMEVID